jgi:murein DD-endopeptidase MepM/ murein hydrolase activator NlpD
LIIISLISCGSPEENTSAKTIEKPKPNIYGLVTDSLQNFKGTIENNENFADLLLPFNVPFERIMEIVDKSKPIFYTRKIKKGNDYAIFTKRDSTKKVEYFVYEKDPVNFVVFDLRDSINIYENKKKITRKENTVAGVINSSLYETLEKEEVDPEVALKLSEVFAWQIDFYRIQNGDKFKAVYEEVYVGDEFIGISKIYAAWFYHWGEEYYAFNFDNNGRGDYFDEEGNSLRKEFLKAPLKFSRISSGFSYHRRHPLLGDYRPHLAIDYTAPRGTPVRSVGNGVVEFAAYKGPNGNFIRIRHNSTYQSGYLHLTRFAKGIRRGKKVSQGDVIGYVGSTGRATGPHLDFRFWKNGTPVNYRRMKFPPSHPVDPQYKDQFDRMKNVWMERLNELKINNDSQQLASK